MTRAKRRECERGSERGRSARVCMSPRACAHICHRCQTMTSELFDNESVGEMCVRMCLCAHCTPPCFTRLPFPFCAMKTVCGCVCVCEQPVAVDLIQKPVGPAVIAASACHLPWTGAHLGREICRACNSNAYVCMCMCAYLL